MYGRLLILCLLMGCISCTEEITPTIYTYTKVFTGEVKKTWQFKFIEETRDGDVIDTFVIGCAEDDEYVFYNNFEHAYEAHTGTLKCDLTEPGIITNTWSFTIGSSTLMMVLPFFTPDVALPFIVREAKQDKMELEIFFDDDKSSYRIHFDAIDEE